MRKTWTLANEALGRKKKKSSEVKLKSYFHVSPEILGNNFNFSFISEVVKLKNKYAGCNFDMTDFAVNKPRNDRSFLRYTLIKKDLHNAISEIRNTAPGFEKIRIVDLKNNLQYVDSILLHLYNRIFVTGSVPDRLKISVVTPIFKKGDHREIGNYRPIGNIPAIANILEKIILLRIHPFIKNAIFYLISNTVSDVVRVQLLF